MQDLNTQKNKMGLSQTNRIFIVSLVVVILLIFGPIEPYGLVVRLAYLIILPTLLWLALRYWGSSWNIDPLTNDRLNRVLAGGIVGALLIGAYLSYTAPYHTECTQYVRDREGTECVGDYVTVKGSDKQTALVQVVFAGLALWYALSKKHGEE